MKTNDIKKGMVVELNNGWFGIMADNMRGNTRMVDVDGMYREIGSVYSHDIINAWYTNLKLGTNIKQYQQGLPTGTSIEHNKKQLELKSLVANY
jgi:hypothetical protein